MATNTTAVAKQVRLQQWAQQITDCQNRPVGMKVIDWCDANGIILPKLTTITGVPRPWSCARGQKGHPRAPERKVFCVKAICKHTLYRLHTRRTTRLAL